MAHKKVNFKEDEEALFDKLSFTSMANIGHANVASQRAQIRTLQPKDT